MKQSRLSRASSGTGDELVKRPAKLEPIRKSGREKQSFLDELYEDEDIEDYKKRESVLDYFDDEDEEENDEELDDEELYETEETVPA